MDFDAFAKLSTNHHCVARNQSQPLCSRDTHQYLSSPFPDNHDGDDEVSYCSDISLLQDRLSCAYLGDAYYIAPYLFDDAD